MVTGLGMSCSRSNGCGRETRAPCVKIELFVSANDMPRGLSFSRKCFFFSSRRPHTSWNCDWSSDVCSSDLDAVKGRAPGLPVSCSADVVAEYREFERFSTTVLNAYLQPLMEGYLTSLEERLLATGYTHGVLTVASSGGMMTTDTARRLPIKTIFSGPAGGVSQACFVGAAAGIPDFITYDMGGTSTDVCLVRNLQPLMTADAMVGAVPVRVWRIDRHTVGAGGGSMAWLDVAGRLAVGPRSAGAAPGPAAYGLGGTEPTVTAAKVVLGRIGTRRRLGGSIAIDAERA